MGIFIKALVIFLAPGILGLDLASSEEESVSNLRGLQGGGGSGGSGGSGGGGGGGGGKGRMKKHIKAINAHLAIWGWLYYSVIFSFLGALLLGQTHNLSKYIESPKKTVFVPDVIDITCDKMEGYMKQKQWVVMNGDEFDSKTDDTRMWDYKVTISNPGGLPKRKSKARASQVPARASQVAVESQELEPCKFVYIIGTTDRKQVLDDLLAARAAGKKVPLELHKYRKYEQPGWVTGGPHRSRLIENSYSTDENWHLEDHDDPGWSIKAIGTQMVGKWVLGYKHNTLEGNSMLFVSMPRWFMEALYVFLLVTYWPHMIIPIVICAIGFLVDVPATIVWWKIMLKKDADKLVEQFPALADCLAEYAGK